MPRAIDLFPQRRGGNDLHSPLRGLLDFTDPIGMTAQAAGEQIKAKIEDAVAFIRETTGIDLSGFVSLLEGLEASTGLNLFDLGSLNPVEQLQKFAAAFQGIDLESGPGAIIAAIAAAVADIPILGEIAALVSGLVNGGQPVNAANIFGIAPPGIFGGLIGVDAITSARTNIQPASSFDTAASVKVAPGITWDGTYGRLANGSVKFTANGTLLVLSGTEIPVEEGQILDLEAWANWSGLAYTGAVIKLGIRKFGSAPGTVDIDTITPAGASSGSTWHELSGSFPVPAGVSKVRQQLIVTAAATAGIVHFDDAPTTKRGGWLSNLLSFFETVQNQINDVLAGNAVTPINEAVQGVKDWWTNIVTGQSDTNNNIQDFINKTFGGLARNFGVTGKSAADVANAAAVGATVADTGLQLAEWTNAVQSLRNNKSLMEGVDETEEANFRLDSSGMWAAATPAAVISATSAAVPVAYKRFEEDAKKGFITWFGKGIVSELRLDIYRGDYVANEWEHIHTSSNLGGATGSSWAYMQYNIASLVDRVDVFSGMVLGIAWRVVGAGTHEVAGIPWNTPGATIHPQRPVSVRTGVGDLAFGSTVYTPTAMPWFGIGIITGDVPPPYNAPRTTYFTAPGAYSFEVPLWADYVDVILGSAGGGGHGGNGGLPISGHGGYPGEWKTERLVRGVDFPAGPVTITGVVGVGGPGGAKEHDGGNGGNTTRAAIPSGKAAMTAVGGLGATIYSTEEGNSIGHGPGNKSFNGETVVGGGDAPGGSGGPGSPGQAPGGGGGGGAGGVYTIAWPGAAGARGVAVFVARQSA